MYSLFNVRLVCQADEWQEIMSNLNTDSIRLRDARYDQVVLMMTAANGAEPFYQLDNNASRSEGLELARELDTKAAQVQPTPQTGYTLFCIIYYNIWEVRNVVYAYQGSH